MITLFNTAYKAISCIYVNDIEDNDWTFPPPIRVTLNTDKESSTTLSLIYPDYLASPFIITHYVGLFWFCLTEDYCLHSIRIPNARLSEVNTHMSGHEGQYSLDPTTVSLNMSEYDPEKLLKLFKNAKTKPQLL